MRPLTIPLKSSLFINYLAIDKYIMHPLNNRHFGSRSDSISIRFWNGSAIVTGHINRQLGPYLYEVTDGTVTMKVALAQNTSVAQFCNGDFVPNSYSSIYGYGTIVAHRGEQTYYIKKLTTNLARTTSGITDKWSVAGSGGTLAIAGYEPTPSQNTPTPLIVADFKNGTYTLSGQTKVFSDLWTNELDFNQGSIVNGQGWVVTPMSGEYSYLSLDPAISANLNPSAGGSSVVVEYSVVQNTSHCILAVGWMAFDPNNTGTYSEAWLNQSFTAGECDGLSFELYTNSGLSDNQALTPTDEPIKVALTVSNDDLAGSVNGDTAFSGVPSAPLSSALTGMALEVFGYANNNTAQCKVVIEKVTIYDAIAAVDLENVSA